MVIGEEESENPRSLLVERVLERVFITVRKKATLRGSPWYTPIPRGIGVVHHSSVETVAKQRLYEGTKLRRSMVMGETELNQRMVDTAVRIGNVQPGYS